MKRKAAALFLGFLVVMMAVFLVQNVKTALRQEDPQGTVTVYLNDGTVWGYYGEVSVTYDRTGYPKVTLENGWLEGSTHPDYQVDGLKGEGHENRAGGR